MVDPSYATKPASRPLAVAGPMAALSELQIKRDIEDISSIFFSYHRRDGCSDEESDHMVLGGNMENYP